MREIMSVSINVNDVIRIEGTSENNDCAYLDKIELTSTSIPPEPIVIVMEAESMTLSNLSKEKNTPTNTIVVRPPWGQTGYAEGTFTGDNGTYDAKIYYFDENDGKAIYKLTVGDTVIQTWEADVDLGSPNPDTDTYTFKQITGISIISNDTIRVDVTGNGSDNGRFDKIEFTLSPSTEEKPIPVSDVYYVDPINGDDDNDGTFELPFATIEYVRDVIRQVIADGMTSDITVYLRGGAYNLTSSLEFNSDDSGRDGYKIIYKNYNDETPIINGGFAVTGWELHEGSIYKTNVGDNRFSTLYENGVRSVIARYPNSGYNKAIAANPLSKSQFVFDSDKGDIPVVANPSGLEVLMWSGAYNWSADTVRVSSINYESSLVTLASGCTYTLDTGSRYYVQGAMELLDQPGEFYLDSSTGTLYYWPRQTSIEDQEIIAPMNDDIIKFIGNSGEDPVDSIVLEGITIRNSDRGKNAFSLKNASNIVVKDCKIHNTGGNAIDIKGFAQFNVIEGNLIYDIGSSGIMVTGYNGAVATIYHVSKNNNIVNNHIYDTGSITGAGYGIYIRQSGDNLVSHNLIHDTTRFAIAADTNARSGKTLGKKFDGVLVTTDNYRDFIHTSGNIIEYNDVSRANTDSQDTGVIYSNGTNMGNILRNNYIHDSSVPFGSGYGIYLDDAADGWIVEKNIVSDFTVSGGGSLSSTIFAKGIGNKFTNNIIANNATAIISRMRSQFNEPNYDLEYKNNVTYNTGENIYYFYSDYKDDKIKYSDYNLHYNDDEVYNIGGGTPCNSFELWKMEQNNRYDSHSLTTDPIFMDADNSDYRLKYDSPAYLLGVEDIDIQSIGLTEQFKYSDVNEDIGRVFVRKSGSDVNKSFINLDVSETANLEVTARTVTGYLANLSGAAITYSSDDDSVASVDNNGTVTANNPGVALISVVVEKGSVSETVQMHVIVGSEISEVFLEAQKTWANVDEQMQFNVYGKSDYNQHISSDDYVIEYASSDESIATIDNNGLFKACKVGVVTITVNVKKNEDVYSKDIIIYVVDNTLDSVTATADSNKLYIGDTTQLSVEGIMSDDSLFDINEAEISFTSADESMATVDNSGKVTATGTGNAIIITNVNYKGITKITTTEIYIKGDPEQPWDGVENAFGGWTMKKYGNADGISVFDNGKLTIASSGFDIFGNTDDFVYAYKEIECTESTASISATIESLENTHSSAASGVMFREKVSAADENNGAGAKNIIIRIQPNGSILMTYRTSSDWSTAYKSGPVLTFPAELKIEKEGNMYSCYYKTSHQWSKLGEIEIDMGNNILAGVAVFSRKENVSTSSQVSGIKINPDTSASEIVSVEQLSNITVNYGTAFKDINLPKKVEVTLDDERMIKLPVTWSAEGYDGLVAGSKKITGTFAILPEGLENSAEKTAEITVVVKEKVDETEHSDINTGTPTTTEESKLNEIVEVAALDSIIVDYGTVFKDISLPENVEVTLDDGRKIMLPVMWSSEGYNGFISGSRAISGTFASLQGNISNSKGYVANITITVTVNSSVIVTVGKDDKRELSSAIVENNDGNIILRLDENSMKDIEGTTSKAIDNIRLEIPLHEGANQYGLELPTGTLTHGEMNKHIEVVTGFGVISIPNNMLTNTLLKRSEKVEISITNIDSSTLGADLSSMIGERPIVQISISADGKVVNWNNTDAPVTVSLPYVPTPDELENPEHIVVWYIDGNGSIVPVTNGRYNPDTGMVTFTTTHFSKYAVAYVKKSFDDLDKFEWSKKAVEVLASKGIIKGTSEKTFAPDLYITRADFIVLLVKTLDFNTSFSSNFSDVSSDKYYYNELGIAKKLGIAMGVGDNQFKPQAYISREDAMTLAQRALKLAGKLKTGGTTEDLKGFDDRGKVASYAVESMAALVKEGLVKGDGKMLNPKSNAMRAEMATFLYRIYNLK